MGGVSKLKQFLFLDLLFLFLCCLGIYQIKEKANLPFTIEQSKNNLTVSKINKANIPFKEGDIFLSINNHSFKSTEEIEVLLDGKKPGEFVTIKYRSSAVELINEITLVHYYTTLDLFTYSLSGILFLLIGSVTVIKSNHKKASQLFFWGCSGAALIITMTSGPYVLYPEYIGFLTRFIFHLAYSITPVIFVHFILNFPQERKGKIPSLLIIAYVFAMLLSIVLTLTFIQGVVNNSTEQIKRYIWIYDNILRVFIIINFLGAVLRFVYSYKRIRTVPDRKKLKWILFGFIIGPVGFVVFWVFPYLVFDKGLLPEFIVIGLLSAVPVTFAIAILKYHFFDIDFIINRSVVYLIVLVSLIIVYLILFTAISLSVKGINETIPAVLSVSAAALALQPAKKRVQSFVDRKFFRVQYNYREALKKFLEEIDNCIDFKTLAEKIVKETNEFIPVDKIGFFELRMPGYKIKLLAHTNFEFLLNRVLTFQIGELKTTLPKPVALLDHVEDGVDIEVADSRIFKRWGMVLVFPFRSVQNEIFGFLVLGKKKSGTRFTIEDIDLLNAVRSKVATTMEKNKYQKELLLEHLEKEKLAELNEMKSFFVSSVSHDLKTPITSIKIFTDMLKALNKSSQKALDYLNIIEGESNRLTRLIDNVLDYTKIEKGVKEYNFEKISLECLVKETLEVLEYQIRMNKFDCQVIYNKKESVICADKDTIKEALINLISNAIKYSGENKKIFVKTFIKDEFAGVEVQDSGMGISQEDLKNIFEPFFRSKYFKGKKVGGTGIGLSIVKHIMDAHKGKIEVNSELEKGSCFTLLFPIEVFHS